MKNEVEHLVVKALQSVRVEPKDGNLTDMDIVKIIIALKKSGVYFRLK